jgi:hypothetical protein
VALLNSASKRNVRQALETLIQAAQAVPLCLEDPDIVAVRISLYFILLICKYVSSLLRRYTLTRAEQIAR